MRAVRLVELEEALDLPARARQGQRLLKRQVGNGGEEDGPTRQLASGMDRALALVLLVVERTQAFGVVALTEQRGKQPGS